MGDSKKTKKQLIDELEQLRQRIADFEATEIDHNKPSDNQRTTDKEYRDLEILNTITQAVHQSLELEDVYKIALDMTTDLENVDMVMIYLVDDDKKEAVLQAQRKLTEDYIHRAGTIPYPKGITWKTINTGEIVNIEDIQKDPNIGPAGRDLGHHGVLGIPITLEEKVIGVIFFLSYKERAFDKQEVSLLSSIGNQISIAIAKAKQTEDLNKRNEDLEILNTITKAVHKSLELEEVYKIALDKVVELENVDFVVIYLVDEDRKEAVIQAQVNLSEDYIRRASKIPYPKGVTWKIINTGEVINIENIQKNSNVGPAGRDIGHHGALGVPISLEEKVIGVIWFSSYKERAFDKQDLELLSSIGDQIALAIAKSKLYEELSKKNHYEEIIKSVTWSIHQSINLQEVLENAVEAMNENIDVASNVSIFMAEGKEAVLKSYRGFPDWFMKRLKKIPYPKGFTWKTIIEGKLRYCADVDKDTIIGPAGRQLETKSYVSIPISYDGKTVGCINVHSYQKNGFGVEELNLLETISHQIGVAVKNAKQAEALIISQKLESVGVLAGGIAHDFNNLLTAILGNISLAALNIKNEDETIKILNNAEEACRRAKDLTNQMLTFSKGGTPIKVLSSIDRIVKESVSFALTGSNVKCEFSIQKNIFPVEVDTGQISQVIQNIIINADQAMPKGGIIKLTAEDFTVEYNKHNDLLKNENYVKITIEDEGIGIPKELINKIFDPFFTTKQRGSGLGLASSYSIIKSHDGDITVESELGKGTIFNIYLPASEKIMSSNKQDASYIVRGKGRILLMDDDIAVSILLEKLLKQLGYDVELAGEGSQAVEIYKKAIKSGQIFDVVILDLTVPGGMGGKETMEILLEVDPDIKAIVTSGYSRDPVMSDHKKYGFKSYVAKPFNVGTLSKILDGVINDQDA